MVLYRAELAGAIAAAYPLTNARIGYQTWLRDLAATAITVSSESSNGPRDAPLRPDSAEYWQPAALPATWVADLGVSRTVDYIGVAGHTLGSLGCALRAMFSADSALPEPHLLLPGSTGNYLSTPDSAALSVISDLTLVVGVAMDDWTPAAISTLANKWTTSGNQRSYMLQVLTDGKLRLSWSANGTAVLSADSSAAVGATDGTTRWLKSTIDVDDGAGNRVIKFWTSTDFGSTWVQLGTTVTTAGVTSIFDSTAPLVLGGNDVGATERTAGKIFYATVAPGVDGVVAGKFDANDATDGASAVSSGTGQTWTVATSGAPAARLNNDVIATGGAGYAPADDAPLMLLCPSKIGRYLQIKLTGASAPSIAVIYAGQQLAMSKAVSGPYAPLTLSRDTVLQQAMSRGGQFLGQTFRRNGQLGSAAFRNMDDAWVRTSFDPFIKSARRYPYFFAWNPSRFPSEVGYCWAPKDIQPKYTGVVSLMDVEWSMRGIGIGT
jgi:hypothetical protein